MIVILIKTIMSASYSSLSSNERQTMLESCHPEVRPEDESILDCLNKFIATSLEKGQSLCNIKKLLQITSGKNRILNIHLLFEGN